jgi:hypothetical protein
MSDTTNIKRGQIIVYAVLVFMLFSWLWNLRVAVMRGELTVWLGVEFVICLWLMIWLWRGAPWARWIVFAIYGFFGLWLLAYAVAAASTYFAAGALILCALAVALALPSVGAFQCRQRLGST